MELVRNKVVPSESRKKKTWLLRLTTHWRGDSSPTLLNRLELNAMDQGKLRKVIVSWGRITLNGK